jgi:hypothetical protein
LALDVKRTNFTVLRLKIIFDYYRAARTFFDDPIGPKSKEILAFFQSILVRIKSMSVWFTLRKVENSAVFESFFGGLSLKVREKRQLL